MFKSFWATQACTIPCLLMRPEMFSADNHNEEEYTKAAFLCKSRLSKKMYVYFKHLLSPKILCMNVLDDLFLVIPFMT